MTKQTLTVHRALSELKLIDSRIEKAIRTIDPIGVKQKDKLVNGKYNENSFVESATKSFQSVNDLIKRKSLIKNAIVLSNSVTKVTVNDVVMTVADAITAKANANLTEAFINTLKAKSRSAKTALETKNADVAVRRERFVEASLGGDKSKAKPEEITALSKMFDDNNEYAIVDPLKIDEQVAKLEENLENFLTEVDAVLSESNAVTTITI